MKKKALIISLSVAVILALIGTGIWYFGFYRPQKEKEADHLLKVQEYRDAKLKQYREENEKYEDYQVDVAFLGDSLTDLYDLNTYYPQYITVNRGIGGDTTFGLEQRLQISVYDLKPKVAVMLIGANNIDSMFDNYEAILVGFRDNLPDTEIVLLSLTAMGDEWGKKNQLAAYNNVKIKLLAEKYGYTFIDLYSPLMDVSTGEVYEGYTVDGGHFTPKGYEVVTAQIRPVLESLLNK